jgi:hypothetical protein
MISNDFDIGGIPWATQKKCEKCGEVELKVKPTLSAHPIIDFSMQEMIS